MTKTITCINCPLGCAITVTVEDGAVAAVTGQGCKRGTAYATQELTAPARMVTTTLPAPGGVPALAPVKTASPIPKDQVLACMAALRQLRLTPPLRLGDQVAEFAGVPIVLTRDIGLADQHSGATLRSSGDCCVK